MARWAALAEIPAAVPGPINGRSDPVLVSFSSVLSPSIRLCPTVVIVLNFEDKQPDPSDL